ncbi:uncharacterized protein LOC119105821 isoform X2 [Pollicipes pollicipes]|nr:uncharacterized protein LOC119105821 isoform X2 [Pollicipes pollicipes]
MLAQILQLCPSYLAHGEARVRVATGELLGWLCRLHGQVIYQSVEGTLASLMMSSLQAAEDDQDKWETSSTTSRDSADVFANTTSWTVLETCLRALERLIVASRLLVTQDLLDLVLPTLSHRNRFVREAGYGCIAAFLPPENPGPENDRDSCGAYAFGDQLSAAVARGLDDNWSQVRMAASVAARRFLCGLTPEERERHLPSLLPRICLSRYYVAEGVKIYNQRTWEMIAGLRGKDLVQKYINDVVAYYLSASGAENHAVREAACYCVSELTRKLPAAALAPHALSLLEALLVCFEDDSWPVRDTACLAVGKLLAAFPEPCRPYLPRLYPLLFANLHDNIPSVRQGGAEALALAVRAYGAEAVDRVMDRVRQDLTSVSQQPNESERYTEMEGVAATYGVVKRQRDNDMDLHTDKQMYSCGSLAPKLSAGGCSASHHLRRPTQPWEAADGSVRLVAELAAVAGCGAAVAAALPLVASAAAHRHYAHHVHLVETVCRALPPVAAGLGKRPFKQHLELFLDTLLYALTCENQLTAEAARCCAEQLSALLGPGIFRGRVENFNPSYAATLDRFLPPPRP